MLRSGLLSQLLCYFIHTRNSNSNVTNSSCGRMTPAMKNEFRPKQNTIKIINCGRITNALHPSSYTNEAPEISSLAAEALVLLPFHDVELPSSAKDDLVTLLDKFDLKIKGISRSREILLNMVGWPGSNPDFVLSISSTR